VPLSEVILSAERGIKGVSSWILQSAIE